MSSGIGSVSKCVVLPPSPVPFVLWLFDNISTSRYCLTHSPVPIIVVRPERKVKKAVEKRKADPKRGTHFDA